MKTKDDKLMVVCGIWGKGGTTGQFPILKMKVHPGMLMKTQERV
jgi:hypothetical protein